MHKGSLDVAVMSGALLGRCHLLEGAQCFRKVPLFLNLSTLTRRLTGKRGFG